MTACNSGFLPPIARRLLFVTMLGSALRAGTITPGAPGADGTVDLVITMPDGTTKTVSVPVTKNVPVPPGSTRGPVATTAAQKAAAIFNALTKAKISNLGYVGTATVTVPGNVKVTGDTTAENMVVADLGLSLPGSPAYASMGFSGSLNPTGTDGFESVFTASFGLNGTTLSATSLSYSQLTSPTAAGLANGLYQGLLAGLSSNLQSDLHLDLSTDTVQFNFAPGSGNYFVQTSSTSPGTSQIMVVGASPAPEPATFLLIGAAMFLIGIHGRKMCVRKLAAAGAAPAGSAAFSRNIVWNLVSTDRTVGRALLKPY